MRTLTELRAFCEGYLEGLRRDNASITDTDDWVMWGGYDINLFGSYLSVRLEDNDKALTVDAYPADWADVLPAPIHSFDITGETK